MGFINIGEFNVGFINVAWDLYMSVGICKCSVGFSGICKCSV